MSRAAALLAAVLLVAGCGIRPTGTVAAGDKPRAGGRGDTITVYLVRDGKVAAVLRPGLPDHPYLPITQLAVPPTPQEREQGFRTEVSRPLEIRGFGVMPGEDVSELIIVPRGDDRGRPVSWTRPAEAQIACTAAALPGIERVQLWNVPQSGEPVVVPVTAVRTLACEDYADLFAGPPKAGPSSSTSPRRPR
ncbi:hypothetical protein [Actinomadura sediminis]|uniref:GerMN domain-containing protein n=1 Tax=Actinomadura sediminis TaxID=1038904 RepID=A0ABW3EV82_9ACTN